MISCLGRIIAGDVSAWIPACAGMTREKTAKEYLGLVHMFF